MGVGKTLLGNFVRTSGQGKEKRVSALGRIGSSRAYLKKSGSATYQFVYELLGFAYEKTGMHAS